MSQAPEKSPSSEKKIVYWPETALGKILLAVITAVFVFIATHYTNKYILNPNPEKISVLSNINEAVPDVSQPVEKLRIGIAEFYPVSDIEVNEAKQLRDRVIESIKTMNDKNKIEIEIIKFNEVIDPLSKEDDERVDTLSKKYHTPIVICGRLRLDEEYYFRPYIYNFIIRAKLEKIQMPSLKMEPNLPHARKVILKEETVSNLADFVSYISALSYYEIKDYNHAAEIMLTIKAPSAEHHFIIASALYAVVASKNINMKEEEEDAQLDDVIRHLDKATNLDPEYDEAWYDKSLVLYQRGRLQEALYSIDKALSFNTNRHDKWLQKAFILYSMKRRKEAALAFEKAGFYSK